MSKITFATFIGNTYSTYNNMVKPDDLGLPPLVRSRLFISLLMLTQATRKEDGLTDVIVDIAKILKPLTKVHPRMCPDQLAKYEHLADPFCSLHNRDYDIKEYVTRVVKVYANLDYVLNWYFESDEPTPFDLVEYARLCGIIEKKAEEVFEMSIWSREK